MSKKNINKEFKIEEDDKYWNITDNKEIFKYNKTIKDIEYVITQKLIDETKTLENILTYDNSGEYNYMRYYKIYDTENKLDAYITYSRVPIDITIKNDLINLNNKKASKLSQASSLLNVKYKLLEIYKVKKGLFFKLDYDNIKTRLEEENNIIKIDNKQKKTKTKNDITNKIETNLSVIDKYKIYINKLVDKTKDKHKHKYYIYKLYDDKNIYIYGGYNKLKKRDIDKIVDNNCIKFEGKIKSEIIKEIEIYSEIEGKLAIDEEIKNNDSIKNGLNRFYNIIHETEFNPSEIFMIFEKEKLNNVKSEKIDNGFIASINIKEYKYIFSDYDNTLYNKLEYFYLMKKHNDKKYDKLIELLKTINYEDIKIELLEKNIDKYNLEKKLIEYLNYYDKDILLNYNEDYYATPNDIKNIKSLVFARKKN
jgi:hypothetical protein